MYAIIFLVRLLKKKVIITSIVLIILCILTYGFYNIIKRFDNGNVTNNNYSKYTHYNSDYFKNKYSINYEHHGVNNIINEYVIADTTTEEHLDTYDSLFYKISNDDYILIQEMNTCHESLSDLEARFAGDYLYMTKCWFPYRAELNKENTKLEPLDFNYSSISNIIIHFTNIIKVDYNYIYYRGFNDDDTFDGIIKCNLKTLICEKE